MGGSGGRGRPLGAADSRGTCLPTALITLNPRSSSHPKPVGGVGGGLFCSERYFLQKPGGAKPGRVPRRWGCSVTSPWTNSWAPTPRGRTGFLCFHPTASSQDGRQIMNRWVGMEGFPEEVVSGLEVEIRRPGVQGRALRKNRNFLHRTGERCHYTCPLG